MTRGGAARCSPRCGGFWRQAVSKLGAWGHVLDLPHHCSSFPKHAEAVDSGWGHAASPLHATHVPILDSDKWVIVAGASRNARTRVYNLQTDIVKGIR